MKVIDGSMLKRLGEVVGDKHLVHMAGAEVRLLLDSVRRLKEALTIAMPYAENYPGKSDVQDDDMARIRELVGE